MNLNHDSGKVFLGVGLLSFFIACSGGGGGGGGTDSGGGEVTEEDLKSISNIPDIDLDALDAALNSANPSFSARRRVLFSAPPSETVYSRAACEVRACVDEFKSDIRSFQVEKCFLEAFEAETNFEVGDGDYNYFEVTLDESEFEPAEESDDTETTDDADAQESEEEFDDEDLGVITTYVRAGVIDGVLNVSLCEPDENGNYSQTLEMNFEASDGKFDGTVTDTWFDDDYQINVMLASENPEDFGEGDEAILEGLFNGQWGAGHIDVNIRKDGGTITNEVDASFRSGDAEAEWGTWTSTVYGLYDGQEGCSVWSSNGTYPAEVAGEVFGPEDLADSGLATDDLFCWVEPDDPEFEGDSLADFIEMSSDGMCSFEEGGADQAECFWFDLTDGLLDFWVHENETATYYETVLANGSLRDFAEPDIDFVTPWDCEAPDGFTEVFLDGDNDEFDAALEACLALEDELDEGRAITSCDQAESEEIVEEELEIEIEDEEEFFEPDEGGDDEEDDEDGSQDDEDD